MPIDIKDTKCIECGVQLDVQKVYMCVACARMDGSVVKIGLHIEKHGRRFGGPWPEGDEKQTGEK